MNIANLDPSFAFAFLCENRSQLDDLIDRLKQVPLISLNHYLQQSDSLQLAHCDTPLFSICDETPDYLSQEGLDTLPTKKPSSKSVKIKSKKPAGSSDGSGVGSPLTDDSFALLSANSDTDDDDLVFI